MRLKYISSCTAPTQSFPLMEKGSGGSELQGAFNYAPSILAKDGPL